MECIDAIAEGKKWSVDICTFNHAYAPIICFLGSLWSSEVNQGEFASCNLCSYACTFLSVLANDLEYSVGSGRSLIGFSLFSGSVPITVY